MEIGITLSSLDVLEAFGKDRVHRASKRCRTGSKYMSVTTREDRLSGLPFVAATPIARGPRRLPA